MTVSFTGPDHESLRSNEVSARPSAPRHNRPDAQELRPIDPIVVRIDPITDPIDPIAVHAALIAVHIGAKSDHTALNGDEIDANSVDIDAKTVDIGAKRVDIDAISLQRGVISLQRGPISLQRGRISDRIDQIHFPSALSPAPTRFSVIGRCGRCGQPPGPSSSDRPIVIRTGVRTDMAGVARRATILFGAALAVALLLAAADQFSGDRRVDHRADAPSPATAVDVVSLLKSKLGLRADADVRMATVTSTLPRGEAPDALELTLSLSDSPTTYTLNLRQHSNRAPDMFVRVYGANGEYEDRAPGPVRTYRGEIIDTATGAITGEVAGSIDKDGQLRGRLVFGSPKLRVGSVVGSIEDSGREEFWIEPISDTGDSPDAERRATAIIYKAIDIKLDQPFTCGVSGEASRHQGIQAPREEQNAAISAPSDPLMPRSLDASVPSVFDLHCANIGCDVDVEYFQNFASVEEAQQRIEDIINIANIQYEHQVQITHRIALIVIRTEEPDPYTGHPATDSAGAVWLAEFSEVDWDVVHLFTGKDIGIAGAANIEGICKDSLRASGFVGFLGGTGLSAATHVSEHELGHNWGATHCVCPRGTMLQSSNSQHVLNFTEESIDEIISYRATRPCLKTCSQITTVRAALPFLDDFTDARIDPLRWPTRDNVTVDPNTGTVAVLSDGSILGSALLDSSGLFAVDVVYEWKSLATDGTLVFEYLDRSYRWQQIAVHRASQSSTPHVEVHRLHGRAFVFDDDADFLDLQLKFSAEAGLFAIDYISATPLQFNPCAADCVVSGEVDIDDLMAVIAGVVTDQGLQCDVVPQFPDGSAGNGVVNIDDLFAVINAFGSCDE